MYLNNLAAFIQVLSFAVIGIGFIEKMIVEEVSFTVFGLFGMLLSYLGTFIVSLFVTIYNKKSVTAMMSSLILFSIFMITWFPINVVSLFKKEIKWEHIGHNRSVNIDDIIKS